MTNVLVTALIARAYQTVAAVEIVGLPEWARSQRYDVNAISSRSQVTSEVREAMLRAILVDRFKLLAHVEKREQPAFDLVLARQDGRLGKGLQRVESNCESAAERSAGDPIGSGTTAPPRGLPDFKAPPPPCTLRIVAAPMRDKLGDGLGREGDLMEGETTINNLATALRTATGRLVVNRTGLSGSYRVRLNFDSTTSRRGPDVAPSLDSAPSVFTAVREQLGLKLDSSSAQQNTLVIDQIEQPTEN